MIKPWLWISPALAHHWAPYFLGIFKHLPSRDIPNWQKFSWRGLHFSNRLGIAGGVDKNGQLVEAFWNLGAGFIEVGTITPKPQGPNPGTIIDRDAKAQALWNKMGFPNDGMILTRQRVQKLSRPYRSPLFINIGKNRETPNEKAHEDYLQVMQEFRGLADVFVVNISSPNTKGLRDLLQTENLKKFLTPLTQAKGRTPLFLKLSPDMDTDLLSSTLKTSLALGIDGWILTNTTLLRENSRFPSEGGVSGKPLKELSIAALKIARTALGNEKGDRLLISVGGVLTPEDVQERLKLGADLVQVYSTLVLNGPNFFHKVAQHFQKQA